jgi:hypothetical protein
MVLDGTERMLSQPLTQLHLFLILLNSSHHFVEQVFVYPARDAASVFAACTSGFDRTLRTTAAGVVPGIPSFFGGLEAEGELLSYRAPVAVLFEVITEIFFAEEAVFAAGGSTGLGTSGVIPFSIQALISLPW